MKKFTKIGLIVSAVCILLGVFFSVIAVASGASSRIAFDTKGIHIADAQQYSYESQKVTGIQKIDVSVQNAGVELCASKDNTFYVEVNVYTADMAPEVEISDNTITVKQETEQVFSWFMFDWSFIKGMNAENKVRIYVPEGVALNDLSIYTNNGAINSNTKMTVDEITADTSNGAIKIENMRCKKKTVLHTSNGAISCAGTFHGTTNAKTSNGKIQLDGDFQGNVECKTSNGAIDITLQKPRTSYNINADTSNGSIRIDGTKVNSEDEYREPNGAANTIDADTSNGSIGIRFSK